MTMSYIYTIGTPCECGGTHIQYQCSNCGVMYVSCDTRLDDPMVDWADEPKQYLCIACGGTTVCRHLHYWQLPSRASKLRSYDDVIVNVRGFFASCRDWLADPQFADWGNDPASVPGLGFHDCGDGICELMGYYAYTETMEEDCIYCTYEVARRVAADLDYDMLPPSLGGTSFETSVPPKTLWP